MEARLISSAESAPYAVLAEKCGKVFLGTAWGDVFGDSLRRIGVFSKDGTLVGGFFFVEMRHVGVRFWRNPPFTPVCGPFFNVRAKHPVAILEGRRKVLGAMAEFLVREAPGGVMMSLDHDVDDVMPFCWQGFKATPKYTYRIWLSGTVDETVGNFTSVRRNDISKARRDGLTVEAVSDMNLVRDLVLKTFERKKKLVPLDLLEKILFQFAVPENSYGFVTRQGSRPIACTFVIHDRHTAYYILGGYDSEQSHHGAGALAVMESIREAKDRGLSVFDFEGSMIPAIECYFRGFGGKLTHNFTVTRAWLPFEILLKFRKRSLF